MKSSSERILCQLNSGFQQLWSEMEERCYSVNMEAAEHEDEVEVPLRQPVLQESIEPLQSQMEPLATTSAVRSRRTSKRRGASRAPAVQPSVSHQTPPAPQVQSASSALGESRKMAMKIEELKAQTALENAVAFNTLSQSFKLIAESIDRISQQYCASQAIQQQPE